MNTFKIQSESKHEIILKRIYDKPSSEEGHRILVDIHMAIMSTGGHHGDSPEGGKGHSNPTEHKH